MESAADDRNEHFTEEEPKALTDWENPPTVNELKTDLKEAQSDHSAHCADVSRWLDYLHVRGEAAEKKRKGRSSITPKLIRKQAEWRYSSLSETFLDNPDLFSTGPVTYEDKAIAEQNGHVLNNQFNTKMDKVALIDEYVRTAVDEGTVILRLGWEFEEDERDVKLPKYEMSVTQGEDGMPMMAPQKVGTETKRMMVTVKNQPTIEVCHYRDVIPDPTCRGVLDDAKFVIYRFESCIADLTATGLYENLDKVQLDDNSPLNATDGDIYEGSSFRFEDDARKKLLVYEYWGEWDIKGDGVLEPILATWIGNTMIRLEENPFPDKKPPFISVQYLPVRKSLYGEPDSELLIDNQKISGAITRGMLDLMGRSANSQVGRLKNSLDPTNRMKFERGDDYEFNGNVDPNMIFFMHSYPQIPDSAQQMLQMQNMEAEAMTGVKAFSEGISGASLGDVASLGKGALSAAAKRELGILRRLSSGLKRAGRKIMAMNAEFLDDVEVVRVTNQEFVEIKREDLSSTADVTLNISSADTDNLKAQELSFMLQTMAQSLPFPLSQQILAEWAKLRKMPALANAIAQYQPEPDPMAEVEAAKLEAEVSSEQAEAQEKSTQAMLNEAKARKEHAETDALDLDFVETESGVKQERELQKQGAQAAANADMKEREAEMKLRGDLVKEGLKQGQTTP